MAVEEENGELQQYVILVRVHYRGMLKEGARYIDPHPEDPWAEDAPRITLEHLSKRDIKRVLARRIVAEDK